MYLTPFRFLDAAEKGDSIAQFAVGELYDRGRGVSKDYKEAIRWYTKAAENGNSCARFNLAEMYLDGRKGFRRNTKKGNEWLARSFPAAEK
jgi:uncharacterized protein